MPSRRAITRRTALASGLAALGALSCDATKSPRGAKETKPMTSGRMPTLYVPHGGGPWPFVDLGFPKAELDPLAAYLRGIRDRPKAAPKALLVVSAHWEEAVPTVMTAAKPPLLFDYYGFPEAAYALTWPAPGDPALAARVRKLLEGAGIPSGEDAERGFDHGTFVPLKLTYPEATIPTVQLSLKKGLDPAEHIAIGRALAPLRDEGVYIVGSGMSFHNMRAFRAGAGAAAIKEEARAFDQWIAESMKLGRDERDARLAQWAAAPGGKACHPREEHLLPLMVVAGAAGDDAGTIGFSGPVMGFATSSVEFG